MSSIALSLVTVNGSAEIDDTSLVDGTYSFTIQSTDGSLERTILITVSGGKMTIHLVMPSKSIVNLYPGLAEDAKKDGAELLQPAVEKVTYSDGMTEEVNAFDLPVPVLDQEFDTALIYSLKALSVQEKHLDKNDESLAGSHLDLARLYDHINDYDKALEHYTRALEIYKKNKKQESLDLMDAIKAEIEDLKQKQSEKKQK